MPPILSAYNYTDMCSCFSRYKYNMCNYIVSKVSSSSYRISDSVCVVCTTCSVYVEVRATGDCDAGGLRGRRCSPRWRPSGTGHLQMPTTLTSPLQTGEDRETLNTCGVLTVLYGGQ